MVLDENLKALLQRGEAKERIQLPVEIGLILKDGEHHLIGFIGGLPVFHTTYSIDADQRHVQIALDYIKTNLWSTVFSTVSALGHEAVQLPQYEDRKEVARLWSEQLAEQTKKDALRRQTNEIKRTQSEAAILKPILKSHRWRAHLLKRSLAAIAELRAKHKRVSQRAVAAIVYERRERYQLDGASAQYWRELKQGFGRPASKTFAMLLKVKKKWEQLTSDEKSELNCPESPNINKTWGKKTRKKAPFA